MRALLLISVCVAGAACSYDYARNVKEGEVRIDHVLAPDGSAAAGAFASIIGTERIAAVTRGGALSFLALPLLTAPLVITLDGDGDGIAEAASVVPLALHLEDVKKNLTDGWLTQTQRVVVGSLLGTVTLEPTRSIRGTVTQNGAALPVDRLVQVVAYSVVDVADGVSVQMPLQASTAARADGSFVLRGLLARPQHVVALVRSDGAPADLFALRVVEGTLDATDISLDATTALVGTVTAQLTLFGATERESLTEVDYVEPGTDVVTIETRGEPIATHTLSPPRGLRALQALTDTGKGGLLPTMAFVEDNVDLAFVEIAAVADPCAVGDVRDCDRDGIAGLPIFTANEPAFAACTSCAGLRGAALDDAVCDGSQLDCDDDSDGVADVDETACLGATRGVDTDGDGMCEPGADVFPRCALNAVDVCEEP